MIRETVDAVRLAEKSAEDIIETAKANANDKKLQVEAKTECYRHEALKQAKEQAEIQMQNTVQQCKAFDREKEREISLKVAELKEGASKNFDKALEAVINALV